MKLWLLSCCFLLALRVQATVSEHIYQQQVQPLLIGIQRDFEALLQAHPNYPPETISALRISDRLMNSMLKAKNLCVVEPKPSCIVEKNESLTLLQEMDELWLEQELRLRLRGFQEPWHLQGAQRWGQLQRTVSHFRMKLNSATKMHEWEKTSYELQSLVNLLVIDFIPDYLQEDFRSAWTHFFVPLRRQGLTSTSAVFLEQNIESLNFYWNLLNVKLTKRLKNIPDGMAHPLNAILNQWNQVMRIYYEQKKRGEISPPRYQNFVCVR